MRSLPIFFAWVSTWRYRERRAATPTVKRSEPAAVLLDSRVCDNPNPLYHATPGRRVGRLCDARGNPWFPREPPPSPRQGAWLRARRHDAVTPPRAKVSGPRLLWAVASCRAVGGAEASPTASVRFR